ncbi:MAG TPA: beta-propeller fold lactonase family protein [Terriglobia bacterium]|nr:beta-propeller fold lactonase family protein [Terriglobia bacterium]
MKPQPASLAGAARVAWQRLFLLLMPLAIAIAASTPVRAGDVIYLESNSTAGNSIFAFKFNFTTSPTLLSATAAGGVGVYDKTFALGPFDSDQNLIENPEGTLLFAVNSGSNTIAVFLINSDGSLTAVDGSPFPSGGSDPVSLGLSDNVLTVVNKDQDPAQNDNLVQPNYTTFGVSPDNGALTPISGSTVSVAYGSSPSQALIASRGPIVFGADFLGGLLQSFRVGYDGRLRQNLPQALPDSVFTNQTAGHQPLGMRTHPYRPVLYVDIVGLSEVAVYTYDQKGRLSFVRTVADGGVAPCWAVVNHAGTRLYATNTGDNSVEVYDLTDPFNPVEMQHFVMTSTTGSAFSTVIDESDQWLYVTSEQSSATAMTAANAFHTLKIAADGTLTEPFPPTVLPIDYTVPVRAQGITVLGAH